MAGLPKKYAKMGFKKGWKAYKAAKPTKSKIVTKSITKVRTVAKKAKRRTYKKKQTKNSMMNSFLGKLIVKATPAVYGYVRAPLSDWLAESPLGKMLPNLGRYGDEITLLGLNYGASAMGARKNVYSRKALQIAEHIDMGKVGEEFYQSKKTGSSSEAW